MFTFPKIVMKMLFLGLVLLTGGASLASPPPLPAQQMQGQAALDFLAHTGILPQIEADTPPQGRPFLEPTPHNATDYAAGDQLGVSVAVSGDTLIVGAYRANVSGNTEQGAAYVFTRSGTNWNQEQKLLTTDGAAGDSFGISVALDGQTALVGANWATVGGNTNQGKVYFFERQRLAQAIDFPPVANGFIGDTAPLAATATSGLPVSYRSETAGICTVAAQVVTLAAAGECRVTATQAGNHTYVPAPEVTISFLVQVYTLWLPLIVQNE